MRTKILILIIILSFLNISIFGQIKKDTVNSETVKYKYALGFGAGFTTGYGLSFKFIPNRFGIQTTFCPSYNANYIQYNIGFTLLYNIFEFEYANIYLYQGNHLIYFNPYNHTGFYRESLKRKEINNGLGFGVEAIVFKHIGINVMYGYAFYDNFDRSFFTAETGLYYKF